MDMCANAKCGKRLIVVDPSWPYHPTPQCDPRTEWAMTPEELAELAARYWPTPNPEPAAQEAQPQ